MQALLKRSERGKVGSADTSKLAIRGSRRFEGPNDRLNAGKARGLHRRCGLRRGNETELIHLLVLLLLLLLLKLLLLLLLLLLLKLLLLLNKTRLSPLPPPLNGRIVTRRRDDKSR